MEIVFSIISVLTLIFCVLVITDMTIFFKKMNNIKTGMTGKEIQRATNMKVEITFIGKEVYHAQILSYLKMFKFRLVFCNGHLISKKRG